MHQHQYQALYQYSIENTENFWAEQAEKFITWVSHWTHVKSGSFSQYNVRWFVNGKLNACYNCLDRHLKDHAHHTALIWQSDDPDHSQHFSYSELHTQVCRFANVLKKYGIKKGDRVCIYLPMIPEVCIAMLACARIGAIHSVVFSAFSPHALQTRILDADCKLVITADEGVRGGKIHSLKKNVDYALEHCPNVKAVIVVKRTGNTVSWMKSRDHWYHEEIQNADPICEIEEMDADDPLFILYTSGSTGKPKGIVHATGGYLVYVAMTFKTIFDYQKGDIYWCTADIGWITGHSYLLYGPLLNGATTLLFEGVPHYPQFSRYWEIIDKHHVNIFYTAPTALRALRKEGDDWLNTTHRSSLKLLGSVGEPINPEVWKWYYDVVGKKRCPIVDTWWQTETGGILISPLPRLTPPKPGSATWPFLGITADIVDEQGLPVENGKLGKLLITQAWPGLMKTIYGDQQRFESYFNAYPGKYLTGDIAMRDEDHYFWIRGREDDVIKVSGHRLGTGELESTLLTHPAVSEAAVVGIPDAITGQAMYAFVTTKADIKSNENLKSTLIQHVRHEMGSIATIKIIQWTHTLPKTRSGKIMRRILRKIASGEFTDLGDTSTLSDPSVIEDLISHRKTK